MWVIIVFPEIRKSRRQREATAVEPKAGQQGSHRREATGSNRRRAESWATRKPQTGSDGKQPQCSRRPGNNHQFLTLGEDPKEQALFGGKQIKNKKRDGRTDSPTGAAAATQGR